MKKLLFTAFAVVAFNGVAMAKSGIEVKRILEVKVEQVSKPIKILGDAEKNELTYRCSDGTVVQFTCGCSVAQATAMGRAWCNAR